MWLKGAVSCHHARWLRLLNEMPHKLVACSTANTNDGATTMTMTMWDVDNETANGKQCCQHSILIFPCTDLVSVDVANTHAYIGMYVRVSVPRHSSYANEFILGYFLYWKEFFLHFVIFHALQSCHTASLIWRHMLPQTNTFLYCHKYAPISPSAAPQILCHQLNII